MDYSEDAYLVTANSTKDTVGKVPRDRVTDIAMEYFVLFRVAPDLSEAASTLQRTACQGPPAAARTILQRVECRLWPDL